VYFPEDGLTKGDLVEYYRAISPWLLPYLRDRPLTLTRFPDGIHGKSFFQKDAPAWRPEWVRTLRVWSEEGGRDLEQYVVDDLPSLLHVVNLGTIPIHLVASRAPDLGRPDWCSVDLDPKGAPFAHVARLARALRDLCRRIGLPALVKTTGQAGLHVLVPLGGQCTHEQARQLASLLARVVADELPDLCTLERAIAARRGRVYLDTLQNGAGKTLAAPFCVRPRPGAPVSTPLRWSEVTDEIDPGRFTIRTVPRRMARLREDPLAAVLELRPDLVSALARLHDRLPADPSGP
jgi:bifunctional non-homologous end joining protein LigD